MISPRKQERRPYSHLLSEACTILIPNLTKTVLGKGAAGQSPSTQTQNAQRSVSRRNSGIPTQKDDVPRPSGVCSRNARIVQYSKKSSHAIRYMNRQKKNHIILSIHAGKAFDGIENKKNSQKNRDRGNFLNLIKSIQEKKLPLKATVKG